MAGLLGFSALFTTLPIGIDLKLCHYRPMAKARKKSSKAKIKVQSNVESKVATKNADKKSPAKEARATKSSATTRLISAPKKAPPQTSKFKTSKLKTSKAKTSKPKAAKAKTSTLKQSTLKLEVCHNCLVAYDPAAGHSNCVPVTERQLFNQFDEDLRDAYYLIKDRVSEFGEQRMYNNARASMFSRRVCYMYVRPKKKFLEVCFFLPKLLKNEMIHDGRAVSKAKFTHTVRVFHADQIDDTLLDWFREAFEFAV